MKIRIVLVAILFTYVSEYSYAGNRGYQFPRGQSQTFYTEVKDARRMKELIALTPVVLGEDDKIKVDVLLHPELSGSFKISQYGTISLPLTGEEVLISGFTKEGVRNKLKQVLSEYVEEPVVIVEVLDYSSKSVIAMGEVTTPGMYPLRGEGFESIWFGAFRFKGRIRTVKDLVMAAGMPTRTASLRRVLVITPSYLGKPVVKKVDLHKIFYKGYYTDDIVLNAGDIVYVPTRVLPYIAGRIGEITSPISSPILNIQSLGKTVSGFNFPGIIESGSSSVASAVSE